MTSDDPANEKPIHTFRTLGICWVVYGIVRLAVAIFLVLFTNTATVMFGALLSRVHDPFAMMNFFHIVYTMDVVLSVLCGVLGFLAGGALLAGQKSGRTLALVAAFFSLTNIPLGLTLGTYTLVVLLPLRAGRASS